jgi:hypothetical protein
MFEHFLFEHFLCLNFFCSDLNFCSNSKFVQICVQIVTNSKYVQIKKITFKSCSVSKKFLNFKMFKFETIQIFIIVHFRKNKKEKNRAKKKNTYCWAVPRASHEGSLCGRTLLPLARRRRLGAPPDDCFVRLIPEPGIHASY